MGHTRILICGSRDWKNYDVITRRLESFDKKTTIIHGACKGADTIAGDVAISLGMEVEIYDADWQTYGRSAGPKRNQRMLEEGKPTLVIAFHNDVSSSKGTADMVSKARKHGLDVEIISEIV